MTLTRFWRIAATHLMRWSCASTRLLNALARLTPGGVQSSAISSCVTSRGATTHDAGYVLCPCRLVKATLSTSSRNALGSLIAEEAALFPDSPTSLAASHRQPSSRSRLLQPCQGNNPRLSEWRHPKMWSLPAAQNSEKAQSYLWVPGARDV